MNHFNDNIDLVKKIVSRLNYGYEIKDDLLQAGLMGLYSASINYQKDKNTKFTTYATYYILGEIKKEIRENRLIKLNKRIYKLIKIIKYNDNLSIDEIAYKYKIEKDELLNAYLFINNVSSLDKIYEDSNVSTIALIPEYGRRSYLLDAIDSLDLECKRIIKFRYFKNYTQTKISKILGINQSKVSRLEKKALEKLRKILLCK